MATEDLSGRIVRRWARGATIIGVVVLLVGCGGGKSGSSSSTTPPAVIVSYVARSAERVDGANWTVAGSQITGSIDSRWVSPADPIGMQSANVNFHGTLQGTHLSATADDGSGTWVGTVQGSHLVLQWISSGRRLTSTFVSARLGDFDAAVQLLGDQVAATAARNTAAQSALIAARAARATQTKQALRAAKRAAARARAAAAYRSAAKAAAGRAAAAKAAAHHPPPSHP